MRDPNTALPFPIMNPISGSSLGILISLLLSSNRMTERKNEGVSGPPSASVCVSLRWVFRFEAIENLFFLWQPGRVGAREEFQRRSPHTSHTSSPCMRWTSKCVWEGEGGLKKTLEVPEGVEDWRLEGENRPVTFWEEGGEVFLKIGTKSVRHVETSKQIEEKSEEKRRWMLLLVDYEGLNWDNYGVEWCSAPRGCVRWRKWRREEGDEV